MTEYLDGAKADHNGSDVNNASVAEKWWLAEGLPFLRRAEVNVRKMAAPGPLAGTQLTSVVHTNELWFAWAAFNPNSQVYAEA